MSRHDPANAHSRPLRRSLSAAVVVAAVCAALPASALNKLSDPSFEDSSAGGWAATNFSGSATEEYFGTYAGVPLDQTGSSTAPAKQGTNVYLGAWTATANNQNAVRTLVQTFTPTTDARAKVRGYYYLVGAGNLTSFSVTISLKEDATDTVLAQRSATITTGTTSTAWQELAWTDAQPLTAGVDYRVEIKWEANKLSNGTTQGAAVDLVELQVSPQGLTATPGPNRVVLAWTPSVGTPGLPATNPYVVFAGTSTNPSTPTAFAQIPAYTLTPVNPNADYYVSVMDVDSAGNESPRSVERIVRTLPAAPGTPTFNSVTETGMLVSWTQPTGGADSYIVERSPDGTATSWSPIDSGVQSMSYTDSGLTCGTTYWYRVRATNTSGSGPASGEASQATAACPTTTIGEIAGPAASTKCPQAGNVILDNFALKTNKGEDVVTAITVTLGTGNGAAFDMVEVTDRDGVQKGFLNAPVPDTATIPVSGITANTTNTTYRVRATPKDQAHMPAGLYDVGAQVTAITGTNADRVFNDQPGGPVSFDNQPPAAPTWTRQEAGDGRIDLTWTQVADASKYIVLRGNTPVTSSPEENTAYAANDDLGGFLVRQIGTNTTLGDNNLPNGTTYHYKVLANDACGNWSAPIVAGPLVPRGTTTVSNGNDPNSPANPLCPGAGATPVDGFALRTSTGTDTVTSVTVSFPNGTAEALSLVEITDNAGGTVYGTNPAPADTTTVTLTTPIDVGTSNVNYRVRITPKAADGMPAGNRLYAITASITGIACFNAPELNDNGTATVTIDNESPAVPQWGTMTDDDNRVVLNWTTPQGASGVLVLRAPNDPVAQGPAEGVTYHSGDTVNGATVVFVGTGNSLTDTEVFNGSTYHYAIYSYDGCRNYSAGQPSGARIPNAAITTIGDGAAVGETQVCPGDDPVDVDAFTLQTSRGSEDVSQVSVRLADGTFEALRLLQIVSDDGGTVHGEIAPDANLVHLTLTVPLATSTTAKQFRIRVAPKSAAAMPARPGSTVQVTASLAGIVSANLQSGSDDHSGTVSIDNLSPEPPAWGAITSAEATLDLHWTAPGDAPQVLILRARDPVSVEPEEGQSYMVNQPLGSSDVAYVGTGSSHTDIGLGDGMSYYYAAFAQDGCRNWSEAAMIGPLIPGAPTTILDEGASPVDASLCPGAEAQPVDGFELRTSWDDDVVTEMTVRLSDGSAEAVALVEITSEDGQTVFGRASNPGADEVSITLETPIQVGEIAEAYRLRITPKAHAELPAPPGKVYEIRARVSGFTAGNAAVGSDANSATLTLDNASPAAPEWKPAVVEDGQLALGWQPPADSDFAGLILARGAGEVPQEGESYAQGDALGADSVILADEGESFSEPRPADDSTLYRLFARDSCGNWSVPAELKPLRPSTDGGEPAAAMGAYDLGGCGCSAGGTPLAAAAALLSLGILRRRRS